MGQALERLISLQRHRDQIVSTIAEQKDRRAVLPLENQQQRMALRRSIGELEAELSEANEAIEAGEKLVRLERADEQFAKRQAAFDQVTGLLAQQQAAAETVDGLIVLMAAAAHELQRLEEKVRAATAVVDVTAPARRVQDEILGAFVKLGVLDMAYLPMAYAVELHPAAAVRSLAEGARQFAAAVMARRPTENPAEQRRRAQAREAAEIAASTAKKRSPPPGEFMATVMRPDPAAVQVASLIPDMVQNG